MTTQISKNKCDHTLMRKMCWKEKKYLRCIHRSSERFKNLEGLIWRLSSLFIIVHSIKIELKVVKLSERLNSDHVPFYNDKFANLVHISTVLLWPKSSFSPRSIVCTYLLTNKLTPKLSKGNLKIFRHLEQQFSLCVRT